MRLFLFLFVFLFAGCETTDDYSRFSAIERKCMLLERAWQRTQPLTGGKRALAFLGLALAGAGDALSSKETNSLGESIDIIQSADQARIRAEKEYLILFERYEDRCSNFRKTGRHWY